MQSLKVNFYCLLLADKYNYDFNEVKKKQKKKKKEDSGNNLGVVVGNSDEEYKYNPTNAKKEKINLDNSKEDIQIQKKPLVKIDENDHLKNNNAKYKNPIREVVREEEMKVKKSGSNILLPSINNVINSIKLQEDTKKYKPTNNYHSVDK